MDAVEKTFFENVEWVAGTSHALKVFPDMELMACEVPADELSVEEGNSLMEACRKDIRDTVRLCRKVVLDTLEIIVDLEREHPGVPQRDAEEIYDELLDEIEEAEVQKRKWRSRHT